MLKINTLLAFSCYIYSCVSAWTVENALHVYTYNKSDYESDSDIHHLLAPPIDPFILFDVFKLFFSPCILTLLCLRLHLEHCKNILVLQVFISVFMNLSQVSNPRRFTFCNRMKCFECQQNRCSSSKLCCNSFSSRVC